MNTVVSGVGPFCAGKSTILHYIQQHFSEESRAKLVFPKPDKSDLRVLKKKRNRALEDPSMTFEYLTHMIQSSAKMVTNAFRDLGPRSFLFLEQSPEYLEIVVKAACKARLISKYQWSLLRTLLDEVAIANVADIFVLFSNEEYEKCDNGHRRTGRTEHKSGSSLQRWNVEIEKLQEQWKNRQKAKGKCVFEVNARISKFTKKTRLRKLMNVVFQFSNEMHGTAFPLLPAAASSSWAASKSSEVAIKHPTVLVANQVIPSSAMPPKSRQASSPGENSSTYLPGMDVDGLHDEGIAENFNVF